MLEKLKVSVLRKMANDGKGAFVVPHNSVTNVAPPTTKSLTAGQCADCTDKPIIPKENCVRNPKDSTERCPHCENMAKNFLYLESLVRSNVNPKHQCRMCYSTLKYLQYVNKSIMQVFGNFDSIVQASKAYTIQSKNAMTAGNKLKSVAPRVFVNTKPNLMNQGGKQNLRKMPPVKKINKDSRYSIQSRGRNQKLRSKDLLKKTRSKLKPKGAKGDAPQNAHSERSVRSARLLGGREGLKRKSKKTSIKNTKNNPKKAHKTKSTMKTRETNAVRKNKKSQGAIKLAKA